MKKVLTQLLYKIGFEQNPDLAKVSTFKKLYKKYNEYTMVPEFYFNQNLALCMKYSHTPGVIVECGVWKGGMSAAIADAINTDKSFFLFDSFEGLPEAQKKDGESAKQWQTDKDSANYYDNCSAAESFAKEAMSLSVASDKSKTIPGWFKDTVNDYKFEEGIAILRLDGDWYDSTMDCLNAFFDQVNPGGIIILDDYQTWDGCSKAVHDFLSATGSNERISSYKDTVYFIEKR